MNPKPARLLVLAVACAFLNPAVSLAAAEEPEKVVENFLAAVKTGDFFGASGLVHPESLEKLKTQWNTRVVENFDKPAVINKLQPYTHGDPKKVVANYSGRVVFERFMEYLFVSNTKMKNIMQGGTVNLLGSKTIAGTTIVSFEFISEEKSGPVSRKDSIRVRKDGLEYKVLLSRELDRTLDLMLNPRVK